MAQILAGHATNAAVPFVSLKAIDMTMKATGDYVPEKPNIEVNHYLILEDARRLQNEITRLEAEIARLEGGQDD
jgi:hypothetical protein